MCFSVLCLLTPSVWKSIEIELHERVFEAKRELLQRLEGVLLHTNLQLRNCRVVAASLVPEAPF